VVGGGKTRVNPADDHDVSGMESPERLSYGLVFEIDGIKPGIVDEIFV